MIDCEIIRKFFDHWKKTGQIDRAYFSSDFEFRGSSPLVDADAWLHCSEVELPMENLVIIKFISTDFDSALLFDGIDPVTLLTYRIAWFFSTNNGKICRLLEVRQSM